MISQPNVELITLTEKADANAQKNFFAKYVVEDPNFAKGSYGKVVLARDLKGKRVVIKMIPVHVASKWILHELEAGKRLTNHQNIVKLVDHLSTVNFHYLVYEFFKGLELYELLELQNFRPLDENDVKYLFRQLFEALNYAHENGICHRDIKLENILVNTQLKLALVDFGLCSVNYPADMEMSAVPSGKISPLMTREFVGSENYTAPEIIKRLTYLPTKADVWSCGIVLYSLLFGQFPWDDLSKFLGASSTELLQPKIRFPLEVPVSDSAKQLLVLMLNVIPDSRISIQEILKHDWFQQVNAGAMNMATPMDF